MALVMLPCDLPWWDNVRKHLKKISDTKNTLELIEGMQKIYELCNISLDPDEDTNDPHQFVNFLNFLDNDLTSEERSNFLNKTLPIMTQRALRLKDYKPKNGLHFSLQQQPDCTELDYNFVSSLLANAFFSTFPKRTDKSHPTLQDFNFANFLKNLDNSQKSKLKSLFYYFDWLESDSTNSNGSIKILRQVMSSKEWLTIEDWLECSLPLCPLKIKHEGKLERSEADTLQICFASAKIGGPVLSSNGNTQECINFMTIPEMLTVLLNVEALEDNEVVTVERVRHVSRISDPKNKANLEKLDKARELTVCCLDADDYTKLPIGQYEEDNILRELNKCLLAFQQKQSKRELTPPPSSVSISSTISYNHRSRRLSPIGESLSSNQSDPNVIPLITQQSCSTTRSFTPPDDAGSSDNGNKLSVINNKVRAKLAAQQNLKKSPTCESFVHNRRGRFIVLGSSGECLPVSRKPFLERDRSFYDSCESSDEEFHSARTSLDDSDEENYHKRYSIDLETPERRLTFAQRLKQALRHEEMENEKSDSSESSNESSYACGISVTGSGVADCDIKVRRAGSTGFALREDSLDEDFLQNSLHQERQWIDKFKSKQSALSKKESRSSDYSFSTDFSSEMEEVYEQFSRWLENPILDTDDGTKKKLDGRELAIVKFAGSILKRTLSESFAGVPVPLTESCAECPQPNNENFKKNRLVLNAKSLSLELAKQKHRLAAQLSTEKVASNNNNISSSTILTPLENNYELTTRKKDRKTWFISCVNEAIVQTLEEVAFSCTLPQNKKLSQITKRPKDGLKSVTTGNWGCGSSRKGDVQLKVIIQWLAASVAGVPSLIYYTCGHPQLVKLDTVTRILIDRKWTVKDLTEAALRYSNQVLHGKELSGTLFEELIGIERTI